MPKEDIFVNPLKRFSEETEEKGTDENVTKWRSQLLLIWFFVTFWKCASVQNERGKERVSSSQRGAHQQNGAQSTSFFSPRGTNEHPVASVGCLVSQRASQRKLQSPPFSRFPYLSCLLASLFLSCLYACLPACLPIAGPSSLFRTTLFLSSLPRTRVVDFFRMFVLRERCNFVDKNVKWTNITWLPLIVGMHFQLKIYLIAREKKCSSRWIA